MNFNPQWKYLVILFLHICAAKTHCDDYDDFLTGVLCVLLLQLFVALSTTIYPYVSNKYFL